MCRKAIPCRRGSSWRSWPRPIWKRRWRTCAPDLADAERSLARQRLQSQVTLARKERQIDDLAQDITDATAERDEVKSMVAAEVSPPSDLQAAERTLQGLIGDREEQILQLAEDREIAALEDQVSLASIAALQVEIGASRTRSRRCR